MAEEQKNSRKVLSNEEFSEYKRNLKLSENRVILYSVLLLKTYYAEKFNEFANIIGISEEELEAYCEEIEFDFSNMTEEKFLADIPENQRGDFLEIKKIIFENIEDFSKLENEDRLEKIFDKIDEKQKEENNRIFEILSNSDLSQVAPESFYDFNYLQQINLEGSGARLDMANFKNDIKIKGSIKGCELITFSNDKYLLGTEGNYYGKIEPDCLDKEQYLAVIEGYARENTYINSNDYFLFKEQEIQEKIQWVFDKKLEDESMSGWQYYQLFEVMTPQTREKNLNYIDRVMELDSKNSNNRFYVVDMIKYMDKTRFDKYYSDILNLYTNEEGKVDTKSFFGHVWSRCNSEIQKEYFDQFRDMINSKDETSEEEFDFLWRYATEETQKSFLGELIEEKRDENGDLSIEQVLKLLSKTKKTVDIPDQYFQEILKLHENGKISDYIFSEIWKNLSKNIQQNNLFSLISKYRQEGKDVHTSLNLWEATNLEVQKSQYDKIVQSLDGKDPELKHEFKGSVFIRLLDKMSEEEQLEIYQNCMPKFLSALREKYKYTDDANIKEDGTNYDPNFGKVLMDIERKKAFSNENVNQIINNLPELGSDLINRVLQSNSLTITQHAGKIIANIAQFPKSDAEQLLEEFENVFSQDNLPSFMKLYKYFELAGYDERFLGKNAPPRLSPVLLSTESKKLSKIVIFSDLMRISMDSNNKSMKKFVNTLQQGNDIYTKVVQNNVDVKSLSDEEQTNAKEYIKTLYFLYEESAVSRNDKRKGKKIQLTGDIKKDFESLGKRYSHDGRISDLPDRVLRTFIGPYQELFEGIDSVDKIKEYMESRAKKSNERHNELENKKIDLETGDLVKGIKNGVELFPDILSDGVRAGEFLGVSSHSDATPLDTDFAVILNDNTGTNLAGKINNTVAKGYGSGDGDLYIVLKYDPSRMEYTRLNKNLEIQNTGVPLNERLQKRNESETIRQRISDRSRGKYEPKKLEVFASNFLGDTHYGVRTGIGATDIDYIIASPKYARRLGYELAMNGTDISIVDMQTEKFIFTTEDYEKIRAKMQGLSYYETGDFQVEQSAYTEQTRKIVEEIFPTGNIEESVSEKEAKVKRSAIQYQIAKSLHEKMGLGVEDHVTGDLTDGFVELIDTGSTGRGTNLPGDGDFDFTLKLDKTILESPTKLEEFKKCLRDVLAIKSDHPESTLKELSGNFRYKKVQIEGLEDPVDIDITFVPKNERVVYSTDMSVRDRLENIKNTDPEGYTYTIANIILAKKLLKKEGIYKKEGSEKATEYGGFGGVGVENWILQNGGSLYKAIETFLEASEQAQSYSEFQDIYPIYDFGQNHMSKNYQHDSFIKGLTEKGYNQMKVKLQEIQKNLTPIKLNESATYLSETIDGDLFTLTQDSRKRNIEGTLGELKNAIQEINQNEQNLTAQSLDDKN